MQGKQYLNLSSLPLSRKLQLNLVHHPALTGLALVQHLAHARQLSLRKNLRNQFSFMENMKVHFSGIVDESLRMSSYISSSYNLPHITPIVFSPSQVTSFPYHFIEDSLEFLTEFSPSPSSPCPELPSSLLCLHLHLKISRIPSNVA